MSNFKDMAGTVRFLVKHAETYKVPGDYINGGNEAADFLDSIATLSADEPERRGCFVFHPPIEGDFVSAKYADHWRNKCMAKTLACESMHKSCVRRGEKIDKLKNENEQLRQQLADAQQRIVALENHNSLLRSQLPEPTANYYCWVEGCKGEHPSKYMMCVPPKKDQPKPGLTPEQFDVLIATISAFVNKTYCGEDIEKLRKLLVGE